MGRKQNDDPNDPIQDFLDWQGHRYDQGYWAYEFQKKGRVEPEIEYYRRANLSSFYRALLIFPLVGGLTAFPIFLLHDYYAYPITTGIAITIFEFLLVWYLVHKAMLKGRGGSAAESSSRAKKRHT